MNSNFLAREVAKDQLEDFMREQTLNSTYYHQLTQREYRKVGGYKSYREIAKEIARVVCEVEMLVINLAYQQGISISEMAERYFQTDFISFKTFTLCYNFIQNQYPVFYLDKNLMQAFLMSKPPNSVPDIKPFAKGGIVLLPPLLKNPDGFNLDYVIFQYCPPYEQLQTQIADHKIVAATTNDFGCVFATIKIHQYSYAFDFRLEKITRNIEEQEFKLSLFLNQEINLKTETEFIDKIKEVLIQVFLYQQLYQSSTLRQPQNRSSSSKQTKNKKGKLIIAPIFIGEKYQIKQIKEKFQSKPSEGGTHASPIAHWRSGHWRNQPYGSRENPQYKSIWIEPFLVNYN